MTTLDQLRVFIHADDDLATLIDERKATRADLEVVLLNEGAEKVKKCFQHDRYDVDSGDICPMVQYPDRYTPDCVIGEVIVWKVEEQ